MKTVEQEQVASAELGLPPGVQAALGELVNAAKANRTNNAATDMRSSRRGARVAPWRPGVARPRSSCA
jgi:ribosomal protein L4